MTFQKCCVYFLGGGGEIRCFDLVPPHTIHVYGVYIYIESSTLFDFYIWELKVSIPYMDPMGQVFWAKPHRKKT